jgi:BolA family transcriptional regulator, general stress-responsive regulator
LGPLETKIREKLQAAFEPKVLEIVNDSHKHSKHSHIKEFHAANQEAANNKGESHFKIIIASEKFNDISRLNRQRMILDLISDEMKIIHAMSIKAEGTE